MGSLEDSDGEVEDSGESFSTPSESTDTRGGGDIVLAGKSQLKKKTNGKRCAAFESLPSL